MKFKNSRRYKPIEINWTRNKLDRMKKLDTHEDNCNIKSIRKKPPISDTMRKLRA